MKAKQSIKSCYRDVEIEKFYVQVWLPLEDGYYEDVNINIMGTASSKLQYLNRAKRAVTK